MKNEIKLSLDKSKKYVVACSFGPDSMALLNAAINEGLNVVVAHVNYRKREAANLEEKSLSNFCSNHDIKIYVLDLLHVKPEGNFQEWAREKRYKFFKKVLEEEKADAVLVAHQQDDVIETYLMQKKRGNFVKNPGIPVENGIFGIKIIRPFLNYSKKELQIYDETNGVPYSVDESNLTDDYTRNKIRHSVVEKLTEKEREQILREIEKQPKHNPCNRVTYSKEEFLGLSYEDILLFLDSYMNKVGEHRDLSQKFITEIKKAFKTKTNHQFEITRSIILELDYGEVVVVNKNKLASYKLEFTNTLSNEMFEIDFLPGLEDRGVTEKHSKYVIKNLNKNDKYIIKDYGVEIRRLFIDWKMPLYLREIWPGIFDENGSLIYIPRYRKNFVDNHKSKFVIKTAYFTEF